MIMRHKQSTRQQITAKNQVFPHARPQVPVLPRRVHDCCGKPCGRGHSHENGEYLCIIENKRLV